jgi:protein TonB
MFAETLLESGVARQPSRGWATTASFSMQLLALAILVALPSVYPEMMSVQRVPPVSVPIFSGAPQTEPETVVRRSSSGPTSIRAIEVIQRTLTFGERKSQIESGPSGPPNLNLARGSGDPAVSDLIGSVPPPDVKGPGPKRPLLISHMDPGSLIRTVQPAYPQIAKIAGIQGQVVLSAIISKSGQIETLQTISGHPMLASAAKEAVRQWRYRPYILNGEPIEVETQITVNFKLGN